MSPVLNFIPGESVVIGISVDDGSVETVVAHTIKVWMLSPGVVLERIVVDMGGLRSSYMGPTESYKTL